MANCNDLNKILRTAFELYDFDGDELISMSDVKTMHYHTNSLQPYPYYKLRFEPSLNQIDQMYTINK